MPRGDWMRHLTDDERKARAAKMRAAKATKMARSSEPDHPVVQSPQPVVMATPSEMQYLKDFKNFLNEYLTALSGLNGLGIPSVIDYCRMCAGNGIHILGCGCVCHRARKRLAEYANEFGPRIESI